MRVSYRPRRRLTAAGPAALGLSAVAIAGVFAAAPSASAATSSASAASSASTTPATAPGFTAIRDSRAPTSGPATGSYTAKKMTVEVSLQPRDQASLNRELKALYTKGSPAYHKFLAKGQFDAEYAPTAATASSVTGYLRGKGLTVGTTSSPFLLTATGSSARVTTAFRTTLDRYKGRHGTRYYANSKPAYVPSNLSGAIAGVVGLNNTVRLHSLAAHPTGGKVVKASAAASSGRAPKATSSCETGYPTSQQAFDLYVTGANVSLGYGAGPGCTGLSPSQTNSIYNAPAASARTQGSGQTAALFELSAYNSKDPATWARQFYGSAYKPKVSQVNVDGGPLSTASCPVGDVCEADYSGDIEVDADIEQEMAVSPDASLSVYNAPNDQTGQTSLDEYTKIANDDTASTVSSSWGLCESDAGEGYAQAENTVFEQMASQGQTVFSAAGDSGAFDCIASDGSDSAAVDDPGSQPWVISAGGTSLGTDNPGTAENPSHPAAGVETVWNPDNLCGTASPSSANDNEGGYWWCGTGTGAGGGGSSQFWNAPSWQASAGISGAREVPDVSADADEFTPYAEYCTGTSSDTNSLCAQMSGGGWFGIGGTSLSAPLWGALIADRDGYRGARSGNIGSLVYGSPSTYFNDIASPAASSESGVTPATDNGLFPTGPGYDEATGLGSPNFTSLIEK